MIAIIVATDQLIWRPVIAWSDKFKFEQVESSNRVRSPLLHLAAALARASNAASPHDRAFGVKASASFSHKDVSERVAKQAAQAKVSAVHEGSRLGIVLRWCTIFAICAGVAYAASMRCHCCDKCNVLSSA